MVATRFHRSNLRLDLFAGCGGLMAIPAALLVAYAGFFGLNVGMILLSALAVLASLASFLGALYGGSNLPLEVAPACGARNGVRAGLLTLILGGGTVVFLSTLLSLGVFGSSFLAIPAAAALLPILGLMVLPVLLSAMVAGWLGGWVESNSRVATPPGETEAESIAEDEAPKGTPVWWKTAFPYILIVSGICYASPLVSILFPAAGDPLLAKSSPPQSTSEPVQPLMPESAGPPKPPPPPYRYETPVGFVNAPASRITLIQREEYSDVLTAAPLRISPDSKLLAICRKRSGQLRLVVIRLDDRQEETSISLKELPIGLAWSQDSRRLLYLAQETPRYAGVLFLDNGSSVELPIPNGERLPAQADLVWPLEKEVVIVAPNYDDAFLDLDTLRVHPLTDSKAWPTLSEEQRAMYHAVARGDYYSNHRWQVAPHEYLTFYMPPNHFLNHWIHRTAVKMAVKDLEFTYSRLIPFDVLRSGERLLATPERSIFIYLHDDEAEFLYFGLREEPELRVSFELSKLFPGDTVPSELETHLANKTLAALICPPIINPLNDKVVGPDRRRIRGMARMAMAEPGKVEFWISEEYEPVRKGDVVADLHYWKGNEPHSFEDRRLEDWWIPLPPLERGLVAKGEEVPSQPDRDIVRKNAPGNSTPSPRPPDEEVTTEGLIRKFVAQHHLNASSRNLDGFAADYAPKTDYFDHGTVDPQFIRADQQKYQEKYPNKLSEKIRGEIAIKSAGNNLYEAKYELFSSVAGEEEWQWVEATSNVVLGVRIFNNVPQIVFQRSTVQDVKRGEP